MPRSLADKESIRPGRRLLTNAHVVANQSSVMVRKHGSAKKYPAQVRALGSASLGAFSPCELNVQVAHTGHECDLALLTVQDDSFWVNLPHMEFGELPVCER